MRLQQILTLCLLLILLGHAAPVAALNFNAFWLHRASGGEDRDALSEWQQRYNLGVGPQLSLEPTHAIRATANVSYTQAQRRTSDDEEFEKTERVSTSSRLSLINDIFTTSLAGSASQGRFDSEWGDVGRSWGATLSSAWDIPFWPDLSFNYSEQQSDVDSARNLFTASDELRSNGSISVDWDLELVRLDYRYSESTNENYITGDRNDSNSHFIRGETGGRLFGDRLTYRLSQQYQLSRQDGVNFGELRLSGTVRAKQMDGNVNPDEPTIVDNANPLHPLYKEPRSALPQDVNVNNRLHVLFAENIDSVQQIDRIRLEFDDSTAILESLSWQVYLSNDLPALESDDPDFNVDWEFVDAVTGEYDRDERVIIIELPPDVNARQILLVSSQNTTGAPLTLSAASFFTVFDDGAESLTARSSENTSWLTNASVGLRLTRTLNASVSMTLEQRDDESSSRQAESDALRTAGESDRRSLSGRLGWSPLSWLSSSIGASETYETRTTRNLTLGEISAEDERTNRTYSWSLLTRPLDTVSISFGVTKTETEAFSDTAQRNGSGMQYSVTTTARIYPDLTAALFLSHSVRDDDNWSEREDRTTTTDNTSSSARIELDARLSRTVSADVSINYSDTQTDRLIEEPGVDDTLSSTDSQTGSSTLNLRYRPSGYLSLRGFYTTYFLDSDQSDTTGAGLTLALLRTSKTRLTMNYSYRWAEESSHNLNLNGSWDITRKLALTSRASYSMAQTDFYAIETTLSLRL